ncbi:MAG: hypothetical protein ACK51L_03915, partial [bacterium]
MDSDKRLNFSVLSMCVVDAWLTWKALHAVMAPENTEDQQTFYSPLAEEMIDNNIDSRARRLKSLAPEHLQGTFTSPNLIKTTHVKKKRIGDAS